MYIQLYAFHVKKIGQEKKDRFSIEQKFSSANMMRINLKEKLFELLPKPVPRELNDYLESLNEENLIITINPNDQTTSTHPIKTTIEKDVVNEVDQMFDEIYLEYTRNNKSSDKDKENFQTLVNTVRVAVVKMINTCFNQISKLNDEVVDLKKQVNVLQQQETNRKRSIVVSELMSPLKKYIYQEMFKQNIPSNYYDVNILKSIYSSNKNDSIPAEFYLHVYKMNNVFDERTLNMFRSLLFSIISDQKLSFEAVLSLLIEKEKRNFEQHSIIMDFIRDSYGTNDVRLTTLLRQQDILSGFQLIEIEILDIVYSKYFSHLFTRI